MRLRLFERVGRLFGLRSARQGGGGTGGHRGPRAAGSEAGGRHRRDTGSAPAPTRVWPAGERPAGGHVTTPPAGPASVARPEWPTRPDQSPPWAGANGTNGANGANRARVTGAGGVGRARIREVPPETAPRGAPLGSAPAETATRAQDAGLARDARQVRKQAHGEPPQPWYQVIGDTQASARTLAQPAQAQLGQASVATGPAARAGNGLGQQSLPFTAPHPSGYVPRADGRRHCGPLESVLWRQWDAETIPPPQVIAAIDQLAEFPRQLQEKLAAGLDGIYVGAGGVPDLDHMAALHGVALPSGRATWDACAGAYGDRKIVVGTRPSPTPDVMCHEVGHALDDLDSPPGKWQSDSAEFRLIYDQCQSFIVSDFHRQRGGLGRKEFFADSFAAIASAQRPALVDMLSGNTRIALRVMLYFNRRYGI